MKIHQSATKSALKRRRPVCVVCRCSLRNVRFHICAHCERRHGPFRFRRMSVVSAPEWYWADPFTPLRVPDRVPEEAEV